MELVEVDIPYEYSAVATKRRSRTPARYNVRSTVKAMIPSLPLTRSEGVIGSGFGRVMRDMATHVVDAKPLVPVTTTAGYGTPRMPVTIDDYALFSRRCVTEFTNVVETRENPFSIVELDSRGHHDSPAVQKNFVSDASTLSSVLETNETEMRELALVDASELVFLDGRLHTSRYDVVQVMRIHAKETPSPRHLSDIYRMPSEHWDFGVGLSRAGEIFEALGIEFRRLPGGQFQDVPPMIERHPDFSRYLRASVSSQLEQVFPRMNGSALVGSGHMGNVDIPDAILEASFDLREAARGLSGDFRRGPDTREAIERVMERMTALQEEFHRTISDRRLVVNYEPKHAFYRTEMATRWWERLERHRPQIAPDASDLDAIGSMNP